MPDGGKQTGGRDLWRKENKEENQMSYLGQDVKKTWFWPDASSAEGRSYRHRADEADGRHVLRCRFYIF